MNSVKVKRLILSKLLHYFLSHLHCFSSSSSSHIIVLMSLNLQCCRNIMFVSCVRVCERENWQHFHKILWSFKVKWMTSLQRRTFFAFFFLINLKSYFLASETPFLSLIKSLLLSLLFLVFSKEEENGEEKDEEGFFHSLFIF